MKTNIITILLGSAALVAIATPAAAQTTGTAAGTNVINTATINYSSGGVAQNPVNSNAADFVVDEKINLTVAELAGQTTSTGGGGGGYVTTFTVTNLSNAPQDFALSATNDQGGQTAFGNTDAFDLTNLKIYVDSNGNGQYDAGVDTLAFIDELAAGATATVFVVGDVPANTADGLYAGVSLTAQAADNGGAGTLGAIQVQSTGADREDSIDIVFADAKGDTDALYDGKHSDDDQYIVKAPVFVLNKTSAVISDPVSGTTDPNRIPGAVIEYCIIATNSGSGDAGSAAITDNLANVVGVTYVPGSLKVGASVSGGVCSGGTAATDSGSDSDSGSYVGTTVTGTLGTLAAGASTGIRFQVTIN